MARTSPDLTAQAVAMRAAGWTLPAISQKTGLSSSTIKRACNKHGVIVGSDQQALVADARKELLAVLSDDEKIRAIYAGIALDTISHIEAARAKSLEAMELLSPSDLKGAALVMRGLTAHATMLKAHGDTIRSLLPVPERDPETLPILTVETLTADAIEEMRRQQKEEELILNGDLGAADDIEPKDNDITDEST